MSVPLSPGRQLVHDALLRARVPANLPSAQDLQRPGLAVGQRLQLLVQYAFKV